MAKYGFPRCLFLLTIHKRTWGLFNGWFDSVLLTNFWTQLSLIICFAFSCLRRMTNLLISSVYTYVSTSTYQFIHIHTFNSIYIKYNGGMEPLKLPILNMASLDCTCITYSRCSYRTYVILGFIITQYYEEEMSIREFPFIN